jgi:hypothetical protein
MQAEPPRQFPNALDGVQVRTVRWQVAQSESGLLCGPPLSVKFGVVIFGIVDDHHNAPPGALAALPQFSQKIPGGHPVEAPGFTTEDELAIAQANGSEIANAFARGRVEQNGVSHFRRYPQPTPRTMLLKMNFVDRPQVNVGIVCQDAKFFYARLVFAGRLAPPPDAVCGNGSPTGERAAGIGGP